MEGRGGGGPIEVSGEEVAASAGVGCKGRRGAGAVLRAVACEVDGVVGDSRKRG